MLSRSKLLPSLLILSPLGLMATEATIKMAVYQTSREGDRLTEITLPSEPEETHPTSIQLEPSQTHQRIVGIGGSFTESAGQVLSELSSAQQTYLLKKWFSPQGAHISLTRTPIASCDFSLRNYTYAPVPGDTELDHFSIEPDRTYLLPLIKGAQNIPGAAFKVLASPWTAPPWMKTNKTWNAGELSPEHYGTFSRYLIRYIEAYRKEGIPIWGITPVNEPFGNDGNWESMHFDAGQMQSLITDHLGPALEKAGLKTTLWMYDQNREDLLLDWAEVLYDDPETSRYVTGSAVHWYQSTIDIGAEILDTHKNRFPDKAILHSEGCIDAIGDDEDVGAWLEDDWYWRAEATDWGFHWAAEENKHRHPPYRPFYRYARDLVEGFNHHFVGWIDWNLILNTRGGPNHAGNFCLAPILVDSGRDKVYLTPLYYAIAHVSKFVRPGAARIGLKHEGPETLRSTAFENVDGSIVTVLFNESKASIPFALGLEGNRTHLRIPPGAMQTIVIEPSP